MEPEAIDFWDCFECLEVELMLPSLSVSNV